MSLVPYVVLANYRVGLAYKFFTSPKFRTPSSLHWMGNKGKDNCITVISFSYVDLCQNICKLHESSLDHRGSSHCSHLLLSIPGVSNKLGKLLCEHLRAPTAHRSVPHFAPVVSSSLLPCLFVFLHMTKLIFKAVTRNHLGRIYCTRGAQQPVSVETLLQHFRSDKLFPLQRARQLRSQEAC